MLPKALISMMRRAPNPYWVAPSFNKYIIPHLPQNKILDIGCGFGVYLRTFGPGSIGLEIDEQKINYCRKNHLNVIRHNANQKLPFSNQQFNAVFLSHVLEHVHAPYNLLQEINRVLKKHGRLIIALPPRYSFPRLLKLDDYFSEHDHLYEFSLANIQALLQRTGFSYQATYVEPCLLERFHLTSLMDLFQILPFPMAVFFSNGFWIVSQKG